MSSAQHDRDALVTTTIETGAALQRWLDSAIGDIKGITYSEYRLLDAIESSPNGAAARVELARSVNLTPSGVTRALRPLEKLGMVETVRHERDARRSLATLTDQGRELLSDAAGVLGDTIEGNQALQRLTPSEVETLMKLLTAIRA